MAENSRQALELLARRGVVLLLFAAVPVAGRGQPLGAAVLPPEILAARVTVSLLSAVFAPPVLRLRLDRWPPSGGASP